MSVNSYDPAARVPALGSRWVWEIDKDHARELVEVVEVKWNGEEWWIRTRNLAHRSLLPLLLPPPGSIASGTYWNDLGRFCQAVTAIAAPKRRWDHREVEPGVEASWALDA